MNWEEWRQKIEKSITKGYAVIMTTDSFIVDNYPLKDENEQYLAEKLNDRALDIRIFNKNMEYRIFRGDVGRKFAYRLKEDVGEEFFDDEQYLDIDTDRSLSFFSKEHKVQATGGGYYMLPLDSMEDVKIKIRNYIAYEKDSGEAYIKDWRLVEFLEPGKGEK